MCAASGRALTHRKPAVMITSVSRLRPRSPPAQQEGLCAKEGAVPAAHATEASVKRKAQPRPPRLTRSELGFQVCAPPTHAPRVHPLISHRKLLISFSTMRASTGAPHAARTGGAARGAARERQPHSALATAPTSTQHGVRHSPFVLSQRSSGAAGLAPPRPPPTHPRWRSTTARTARATTSTPTRLRSGTSLRWATPGPRASRRAT